MKNSAFILFILLTTVHSFSLANNEARQKCEQRLGRLLRVKARIASLDVSSSHLAKGDVTDRELVGIQLQEIISLEQTFSDQLNFFKEDCLK